MAPPKTHISQISKANIINSARTISFDLNYMGVRSEIRIVIIIICSKQQQQPFQLLEYQWRRREGKLTPSSLSPYSMFMTEVTSMAAAAAAAYYFYQLIQFNPDQNIVFPQLLLRLVFAHM